MHNIMNQFDECGNQEGFAERLVHGLDNTWSTKHRSSNTTENILSVLNCLIERLLCIRVNDIGSIRCSRAQYHSVVRNSYDKEGKSSNVRGLFFPSFRIGVSHMNRVLEKKLACSSKLGFTFLYKSIETADN